MSTHCQDLTFQQMCEAAHLYSVAATPLASAQTL